MLDAYFSDIHTVIKNEISRAENSILICMYWFTNKELFRSVLDKLSDNVSVELIIHNDYVNNRTGGLDLQKFIDIGGKLYFSEESNPTHNKFCIIDNAVLINGSYNWTYYAETKNYENIFLVKNEPKVVSKFNSEFSKIVGTLELQREVLKVSDFEISQNNNLDTADYLAHDLLYEAKVSYSLDLVKKAFEVAPTNLKVQNLANDLNLIHRYELKSTIGVSIENDGVKVIAVKGSKLPAVFTTNTRTSYDYQSKTKASIIVGDNSLASMNTKLAEMELDGLVKKKKGEAEVKFSASIDINGRISIVKLALDNGVKKEVVINRPELVKKTNIVQ